jgi:hypothetical protein
VSEVWKVWKVYRGFLNHEWHKSDTNGTKRQGMGSSEMENGKWAMRDGEERKEGRVKSV